MMKIVFATVAFLTLLSFQAFSQSKLNINDGKDLEFGEVNAGSKITKDVVVKNTGKDTLRIDNVKAQCGCTGTLLSNPIIPPNDSAKISVTFDSKNYPPGPVTKHVYITSNDTTTHNIYSMAFVTTVITPLMIDPAFFSFPNAKVDSSYPRSITMTNKSKVPITIKSFTGNTDQIKFTLDKKKIQPGDKATIDAVLHPQKSGSYQGILEVFTDIPDQPKIEIRYMAWINRK